MAWASNGVEDLALTLDPFLNCMTYEVENEAGRPPVTNVIWIIEFTHFHVIRLDLFPFDIEPIHTSGVFGYLLIF